MAIYTIETFKAEHEIGALFTFWGTVALLKKDGKSFSKYYIKSKEIPTLPKEWEIESHTFSEPKTIKLKKGETINKVEDNLGNVYFDTTSLI